MNRTLVICKPDAVERGLVGEIIGRLERKGLTLVAAELRTIDEETASRHYAEHEGKPFYDGLVDSLAARVVETPGGSAEADAEATPITTSRVAWALFPYLLIIVVFGVTQLVAPVKRWLSGTDLVIGWPGLWQPASSPCWPAPPTRRSCSGSRSSRPRT